MVFRREKLWVTRVAAATYPWEASCHARTKPSCKAKLTIVMTHRQHNIVLCKMAMQNINTKCNAKGFAKMLQNMVLCHIIMIMLSTRHQHASCNLASWNSHKGKPDCVAFKVLVHCCAIFHLRSGLGNMINTEITLLGLSRCRAVKRCKERHQRNQIPRKRLCFG